MLTIDGYTSHTALEICLSCLANEVETYLNFNTNDLYEFTF